MDELTAKIHMQYLEEEIFKMEKTAKGIKKMISNNYKKNNDDLVHTLQKLHKTTLKNIKNKKKELKDRYNKEIENENN